MLDEYFWIFGFDEEVATRLYLFVQEKLNCSPVQRNLLIS